MSHSDYIGKCDESQLKRLVEMANERLKEIQVSGWVRVWTVSVGRGNIGWFREGDYAAAVALLCQEIKLESEKRPGKMLMANIELENVRPEEVEALLAETPKPQALQSAGQSAVLEALEQARHALKEAGGLYALGFNVRHAETCATGVDETGCTKAEYEKAADEVRATLGKALDQVQAALVGAAGSGRKPATASANQGATSQ